MPPGMCLNHLADDIQIFLRVDLDQHDRQITRDGIAPQAGLSPIVFGQDRAVGTIGRDSDR